MTRQDEIAALRARSDDDAVILKVMVAAFHRDPISTWLVPDDRQRPVVLGKFFAIMVNHALDHGVVEVHPDRVASSVWMDPKAPIAEYDTRLREAVGVYHDRFVALDEAFHAREPERDHYYGAFLAVSPQHQRKQYGGALMAHRIRQFDRIGMPTYLVASTAKSSGLYIRHGFAYHGLPLLLPDSGPTVYPMWREAQPPTG